ncbi:hypothetical protein ASG49_10125 [Marmoricola sp. Leaf446]|uniref:glycosyltransferase family 2 protein n=1 Tax=Marmoricola sp. Leaf446 TaxID=1736379 RepID=UPI0006F205E3|nr:glycosyltransferase family A protein [Marmoricola sp. Leaf446]KQT92277.1 hypothetical protein ASG49_10125 [Marmoricola sp. Leaf446]
MNEHPTIAAVIANYNYGRYLGRAIESVLEQDDAFSQVVVVDDGSTDDSLEVARAFEGRVEVIANHNSGQLAACLAGVAAVDSDYVYLMDADDAAHPELVSAVREELPGRPVMVQFQLRAVDGAGLPTGSVFPTYPEGYDTASMRHDTEVMGTHQFAPTSGNVFRRDLLAGLDTAGLDLRDAPDGPVAFAMPYLGSIAVIDRPLASYRVHGSNRSQWFAPTPDLLRHELDWFRDRWRQTCLLLGRAEPPFAGTSPVYELELELLVAALEGRWWVGGRAWRYARGLRRSRTPRASVLALQVWAMALVVPSTRLRRRLVMQRRAPAERPRLVRALVSLVRRSRR